MRKTVARINKSVVINDYKKYWIEETAMGHIIKICYGPNDHTIEIDCRWKDRERGRDGRPENKKK
tara:strand:+ start:1870 stop:2064 length:195 start_codon:yes stop_codon:yes gene_type:complete